jgi:hypothetical protein
MGKESGEFIPSWIDRDDLDQVEALARVEAVATGFDADVAARKARADFVHRERKRLYRETPASGVWREGETDRDSKGVDASLGWVPESKKVVSLSPPKRQTDGQRKRFVRNQVIFAASLAGFSQRNLGLAFDMPHSRIHAIVEEMKLRTGRG